MNNDTIFNNSFKVILTIQVLLLLACLVVVALLFDALKTYQNIGVRLGKLENRFNRWIEIELDYEARMKELSIFAEKNGYKNWKYEEQ